MKKLLKTALVLVLALSLSVPAFAGEYGDDFSELLHALYDASSFEPSDDIGILIDFNYFFPADANGQYVPPFIENGSTYVPLRAIAQAFDLAVSWEQETKTVYIGEKGGSPVLSDNINIYINGREFEARDANGNRVYPILKEGTTYMPLRAIGEAFGKNIAWDNVVRYVYITTPASDETKAHIKEIVANTRAQDAPLEFTAFDSAKSVEDDVRASVKSYLSCFITDDILSSCVMDWNEPDMPDSNFITPVSPDELCAMTGFDKNMLNGVELGTAWLAVTIINGKITYDVLIAPYRENGEINYFGIVIEPSQQA